jgi:hypothetical protein
VFNEFPSAGKPGRQRPTGFGHDGVTRLGRPCSGISRIFCPSKHGNADERRNDPSHSICPFTLGNPRRQERSALDVRQCWNCSVTLLPRLSHAQAYRALRRLGQPLSEFTTGIKQLEIVDNRRISGFAFIGKKKLFPGLLKISPKHVGIALIVQDLGRLAG